WAAANGPGLRRRSRRGWWRAAGPAAASVHADDSGEWPHGSRAASGRVHGSPPVGFLPRVRYVRYVPDAGLVSPSRPAPPVRRAIRLGSAERTTRPFLSAADDG